MDEQLCQIQEGVRRAKAAWLCGQETILAQVEKSNEIVSISLRCLRSPKTIIEDYGSRGADWDLVYRATQRGEVLPPIFVLEPKVSRLLMWRYKQISCL